MFRLSIPEEMSSAETRVRAGLVCTRRLFFCALSFGLLFGAAKGGHGQVLSGVSAVSESRPGKGAPKSEATAKLAAAYGKVPLSFEPNLGQVNLGQVNEGQTSHKVQWVARGPEYALFLSGHDAVLELNSIVPAKAFKDRPKIESAAVRMNLLGAKAVTGAEGEERQPGKTNYFTGRDQSKWLREVPMFGKVRLREVYPGIDLVYYGRQGQLEYDFVVSPGADPAKINLKFEGAKANLANGDLVLPVNGSEKEIRFDKPTVYQMKGGVRRPVAGAFRVESDGTVSFDLGSYDRTRELVIDPTLVFAGSLATGNQQTIPTGMAVDKLGEMVITGYTNDLTFPVTTGALQTNCQTYSSDAAANGFVRCGPSSSTSGFVTKLSADGAYLIYSTYLHGGGGAEQGHSVAVDAAGDAYILGSTSSNDFPITSNAYQSLCQPTYSTGGNFAPVQPITAQCDNFHNGGGTEYTVNGPTLFIAELNPLGTALIYSTFFGGSASVYPVGIALDAAGNMIFASGVNQAQSALNLYPNSTSLPFPTTTGGYQTTGINVYTPALSKLSADGQTLMYSTFLGSQTLNVGHDSYNQALALGQNGVAYLGGYTQTSDFPTTAGSFKPACGLNTNDASSCFTNQGFVAAIDTTKSGPASLVYASYLGGEAQQGSNIPEQEVYGLAADASNNLFVTGYTYANDFPSTVGVYQPHCNDVNPTGNCNQTAFLSKVNPTGTALTWSTLLGDTRDDGPGSYGASIAFDSAGQVYLYGLSQDGSGDFPLVNPISSYTGGNKVFLATFSADATKLLFSTRFSGPSNNAISLAPIANGLTVDSAGNMYIAGYSGDGGSFGTTPGAYSTAATSTFNRAFFAKVSPMTPPSPSNGLTTNLLANPGAELGSLADWTSGGNGTPQVDNGTYDSGINPHTGSYDFVGGYDSGTDSLSQTVSILQQGITAAQVDGGTLFANVSFWEQGLNQGDPSDEGSVTLTFLDGNSAAIGSAVTIGPEDSHDGTWANVTGIPAIPAGTRSITYTMNFIKNQLTDNDGFIDDNILSIHTNTGLTIYPGTLHFGNVAVGSQSAAQTVSVTNQQTTTINIQQILSELGANPSDFLETDNCPSTGALAAGASCTLTITFVPDGVGPKSAGIAINDDNVPALQQVSVDGTGTGGILQVNPGNLKTIAGIGTAGDSGDGGPATMAQLNQPNGVAFDPSGNLYIADDQANVIRKVDTTGKITTFAGTGGPSGFSGDGGQATAAQLSIPFSVASDKNGNIYIQDTGNYVIRKVDATTGIITTVAGTPGTPGRSGDGGPATAAKLNENQGARFDSAGNFYVAVCPTGSVRKIDTTGVITTVAGTPGTPGFSGDGGLATAAELQCPSGVTIDAAGNFYIADEFNQVIRKVNAAGVISTIAGTPGVAGSSGDGGAATAAKLNNPNDVVIDSLGNLYVADSGNNRVRKIDVNGVITTAAGGLNNAGSAAVNTPLAVTVDTAGDVYFSDSGNSKIQEIFPQGVQPFPATQLGSTSAAQSLTLSNIGNVDVTLGSDGAFSLSGDSSDFALTPGSCGNGMVLTANGGSCAVSITFAPTALGQRTLTVMISDDALNSPQSFSIGGTGVAAGGSGGATPVITWAMPAAITTTTPLSGTQLDATAADGNGTAIPGTFVYTPAAGSYLNAGTQTLSVTFTPTDTATFTTATKTVQIVVTQASGETGTTGAATSTTLAVTSGGGAVTTVASGSVVTLTAAVKAGTNLVRPAQVAFCDAAATSCTGPNALAIRQITDAGTAVYRLIPGLGAHSYRAVFLGTNTYAASASATTALMVTGTIATTTAIAQSGAAGNYTLTATTVGSPYPVQAPTQSVTINLGQSAQNYVLTGTGGSAGNGGTYGNYYNTQGSCVTAGSITTCDLTGPFTSSTPGYAAGTYDFQTVFTGSITSAVTSQTQYPVGTNEPNDFQYSAFAPSTAMTLKLNVTGGGAYTIPLVENGNFDPNLDNIAFADTAPVCGGTSLGTEPCQQDYVGTVVGATYSSPVTGFVQFEMASSPTLVGPTGTVSFLDTTNANAVLGTGVLGAATQGFALAPAGSPLSLSQPFGGVSGDFNGDGLLDLAVLGNLSDQTQTLNIYLGSGDGTFKLHATYSVQTGAGVVQVADVNGDGIPDLVVPEANLSEGGSNAVFLGNGDGTFKPEEDYSAPEGFDVGLSDLNHDGLPDIVGLYPGGAQIYVQLNNGDGSFKAPVFYPSGNFPNGVAEADFDGDGNIDVAIANQSDGTVSVLLGKGDGTFQPQVTYAVGSAPASVRAGDFNEDGAADLVVVNSGDGTIGILLGNGNGTFGAQKTYAVGSMPFQIAVADLNGDGHLDITISNSGSSTQSVVLGNGDGTFQTQVVYGAAAPAALLGVGDFNGDGRPDVAVGIGVNSEITTLLSQVTETAVATATGVAPVGAGNHAVVASYPGDANFVKSVSAATNLAGTGAAAPVTPTITWAMPAPITTATPLSALQLDATATDASGAAVAGVFAYTPPAGALLAAGTQTLSVTFTPTDATDFTTATKTVSIVVTQAAAAATTTTLTVSSGGSAVTTVATGAVVTLTATVSANQNSVSPGQVAFCDATAASCTDIHLLGTAQLIGGDTTSTATYRFVPGIGVHSYKAVFLGTKAAAGSGSTAKPLSVTGTYATATTLAQSGAAGSYTLTATTTSANGANVGPTGTVSFLDTSNANAVLGTGVLGAGTETTTFPTTSNPDVGAFPDRPLTGDLNGDGKLDVVIPNPSLGNFTVLLGNGDGTFTAAASPTTPTPGGGVLADFNGDGILDIAVTNASTGINILLGNGDGTFAVPLPTITTGQTAVRVSTADFNGDGIADLAVTNLGTGSPTASSNTTIAILLGKGDGTFTKVAGFAVPHMPHSIVLGDFNGDGKTDIAAGLDGSVGIYLGNGDGSFTEGTATAVGIGEPFNMSAADLNKDGRLDLVVADLGTGVGSATDPNGQLLVLLGNGDGTFSAAPQPMVGIRPSGVVVADFNGDGIADIATANQSDNTATVLLGKGDGTFTLLATPATDVLPTFIAAGDFNSDGRSDLITTSYTAYSNSAVGKARVLLTQVMQTAMATASGVAPAGVGTHQVVASYLGDANYAASVSAATPLIGTTNTPVITWMPAVATIAYGTALGAQQLNATAATAAGVAIPGTFVYTPAAGTVLTAGMHTLSVAFTPTSTNFSAATGAAAITVTQATPGITWAAPAGIAYGTALSATQLDATVAGVGTGALAGTLVYTPAAGVVLAPGMQTLSVVFTPADAVDYTTATASVPITVGGLALSSFTPVGALIGSADTKITLTGTGFVTTSMVMVNGAAVATAYVSPTMLTAVIPAALLRTMGTLAVTVIDPAIGAVTVAQTFTVLPPTGAATLTGPATADPGSQPTATLTITNPYPLALTAEFSLAFASEGAAPVDDPSIQFSSGGRTYSYTVAANSTSVPPVELQAGTDAGTITITAKLMADGVDVTPAGLAPLVIVVPPVVPVISGTTITASGNMLTVVVHGFSNTREVSQAVFDFTAATGDTLGTSMLTVPATTIFSTWYTDATSDAYGSTFTYTQVFNTSSDAKTIGSVKVTLTNSVGTSAVSTSQ